MTFFHLSTLVQLSLKTTGVYTLALKDEVEEEVVGNATRCVR